MKNFPILLVAALAMTSALSAHNHFPSSATTSTHVPSSASTHGYREMPLEQLVEVVKAANPSIFIVDARSVKFDDGKRIPGAKAIPADAPIENISANLPDKAAMVIVYCSNIQCPASQLLADRLVEMGYTNVWKYPGGIKEWKSRGHQLEQGKPASQAAKESGPKSA